MVLAFFHPQPIAILSTGSPSKALK